jgi:hypothetical protein
MAVTISVYMGAKHILQHQGHSFYTLSHNHPNTLFKETSISKLLIQFQSLKELIRNKSVSTLQYMYQNTPTPR